MVLRAMKCVRFLKIFRLSQKAGRKIAAIRSWRIVSESNAVQRLADYRVNLLEAEVYPVSLIWHTDAWTTITNILRDAVQRRKPEGFLDAAKDFMLDRLDDALEPLARSLTGKLQWDEMKGNARLATEAAKGGVRLALDHNEACKKI